MYRKLPSEAARLEQEELDIRCLQLLRATIHNEERKLPDDWEENAADNRKYGRSIVIAVSVCLSACLLVCLSVCFFFEARISQKPDFVEFLNIHAICIPPLTTMYFRFGL